jgi:hypothetical protein
LKRIKRGLGILAATALVVAGLSAWPASASAQPVVHAKAAARPASHAKASGQPVPHTKAAWQKDIAHVRQPGRGCYHASYPALVWHAVKCATGPEQPVAPAPLYRSATHAEPAQVGAGTDDAAQVSGLITQATGTFDDVGSDITEEGKVGDSGPSTVQNAFSLQLNSEKFNSPACSGSSDPANCLAWQQFLYTYTNSTTSDIYMQYWLFNYDGTTCPSGWQYSPSTDGSVAGCFTNSGMTPVSTLTAGDLSSVQLTGTAAWGGNDAVSLSVGSGQAAAATNNDSVFDLAGYWNQTEWGVFGDEDSNEANFGADTSLEAETIFAGSISSAAPSCPDDNFNGYTNETNNLGFATTPTPASGTLPAVASLQTSGGSTTPVCAAVAGAASATAGDDSAWDNEFQSYGDTSDAWSGGDGAQSLKLPDGNTMWFFADTYLGQTSSDGTRPPLSTGLAHNSAVLYNASTGTLGPTSAASVSGSYNFLDDYSWVDPPSQYPSSQYELINGDQVVDGDNVYKFYELADRDIHPDGFGYMLVGTVLEEFSISGNTLTPVNGTAIGIEDAAGDNPILWGTAVMVSGGYIYIYGTKPYNTSQAPTQTGADAYPLYLARVPVGGLFDGTPWQYYDAGAGTCEAAATSAWSSNVADAGQLMTGGTSSGFSVTDVDGTYVLLTNNSTGTYNNAVAYYASCPTGFSSASPHYVVYQSNVPSGYLTYEYRIVPQFSDLAGGEVLISFSQDSGLVDASCMLENYYNSTIYRPEFLDVQLPNLSLSGSSGSVTDPPDPPTPPSFSSPPVSPDDFYTPTEDYPGTSTETQDYCSAGATPSASPTLTLTGNSNDVMDISWSMQPTAMWMYSVVYCNVTEFGKGTKAGECPANLVGSSGANMTDSIPECSNTAAPNVACGYNLDWGNTSSTVAYLIPGDVYEVQICTALAVLDEGYVGSNVLTVTAT